MATDAPIMGAPTRANLTLRFIEKGRRIAPHDLRSRIGAEAARFTIARNVENMINLLDEIDGDPDFESDDDGQLVDADGNIIGMLGRPAGTSSHWDEDREHSYAEWHTLPACDRHAGRIDGRPLGSRGSISEDEEDDDRDEGVEDGPFDPEEDKGIEDDPHDPEGGF